MNDTDGQAHAGRDLVTWRDLERELQHLRNLLDERERFSANALKLQANEYERRLHELNNAHLEARKNWEATVQRPIFDRFEQEFNKWQSVVSIDLDRVKRDADKAADDLRARTLEAIERVKTDAINTAHEVKARAEERDFGTRKMMWALSAALTLAMGLLRWWKP